ncbi:alkaline phosphatase [soil metagenome]
MGDSEVRSRISRRRFLGGGAAVAGGAATSGLLIDAAQASSIEAFRSKQLGAAALARSGRPIVTYGVQSGDITRTSAVVWARANRQSRMVVEVDTSETFSDARAIRGPVARAATDFTAQLDLSGLPPAEQLFYRVFFEDLDDRRLTSEPSVGSFRTAPVTNSTLTFVWSGDTAGQGWGINPDFGGMRLYETMRALKPDFFVHSGDTVYADGPISESVTLPDGTVWRNIVTPEKVKVAETLDEFRGNYKYNLIDPNVRSLNAEVPIFDPWDDHETLHNWYPGEILDDPLYTVTDVDLLAARARRAFVEFMPLREQHGDPDRIYRKVAYGPLLDLFFIDMRTYRGPNTSNDQRRQSPLTAILGRRQLEWLKLQLRSSRATWKVIASDMPLGLVVPDTETTFEGVANDHDGRALGRELELAELLSFIKREAVDNVVWITADVHYTAAHHYDPARATFNDFKPFWEFVSGPINAGTFGPNELDRTFGPRVVYQRFAPSPNLPPSAGLQFFGHVTIDGSSGAMTVQLKDLEGTSLHSTELEPEG